MGKNPSVGRTAWDVIAIIDTIVGVGGWLWPTVEDFLKESVEQVGVADMDSGVFPWMAVTGVLMLGAPRVWDRVQAQRRQGVLPGSWINRVDASTKIKSSTVHIQRLQERTPLITGELVRYGEILPGQKQMVVARVVDRHHREVVSQALHEYRTQRDGERGYLAKDDLYHEDTLDAWLIELGSKRTDPEELDGDDFDPYALLPEDGDQ